MAESDIKDLIWHHSFGVQGVRHLKENEYFEKANATRIDFSKGIAWIMLTSFEAYQQRHENGYLLQVRLREKPDVVLNLFYKSKSNEISLVLLFDGIEYEITDRLESQKKWRTVGFSLIPKTNGFEMKLYIDEEQIGLEIVPPKKLDHAFWRFKMATDCHGKNGLIVDFAEDMAFWTLDEENLAQAIQQMNKIKEGLIHSGNVSARKVN